MSQRRQMAKKSTAKRPRVEQNDFSSKAHEQPDNLASSVLGDNDCCTCTRCICTSDIIESTEKFKWDSEDEELSKRWETDSSFECDAACFNSTSISKVSSYDQSLDFSSNTAYERTSIISQAHSTPLAKKLEFGFLKAKEKQEEIHESIVRLHLLSAKLYEQINTPAYYMPNLKNSTILDSMVDQINSSCDALELLNSKIMTGYSRMVNKIY